MEPKQDAYLLGVMSSMPFDWIARCWVELNFTFEVLYNLPVPLFDDGQICSRIVAISAQIAAVDERFSEWAGEVGVAIRTIAESEREEMLIELDALVAISYGLDHSHLATIYNTFRDGSDFSDRHERVKVQFEKWKEIL
jgi:hypothetical protein